MTALRQLLFSSLFLTSFVASQQQNCENSPVPRIAVANRGKGDALFIDSQNEHSLMSIQLHSTSEPMYISASTLTNEFYIGDRKNSQLYVYDTTTLQRVDIIPACNGIFHQFYNERNQLWIVCDIDLSILVINTETRKQIKTINIKYIQNSGFKPHDITSSREYTYVSLLKPDNIGIVIQYSTQTLEETNRIQITGDPHLYIDTLLSNPNYLYIASETGNLVYKLSAISLQILNTVNIDGAHGIWGNKDYLYVTNFLSENGVGSLNVIDLNNFDRIRQYDSVVGSAHNLMINSGGNKLFVTHSSEGIVSVYDIGIDGGLKGENRIIFEEGGSKPFGIMELVMNNVRREYGEGYSEY
eukprot:281545_1